MDVAHNLVSRPLYDELLDSYLGTETIKVLSGVRRCGKSSLLLMLASRLVAQGVPANNILYKKLDSYDVPLEPDAPWLEATIKDALDKRDESCPFYVFLDEVQEVKGWEKVVRRLHTERVADIYLTGSNAFLLSSDLATYLSGRYVEVRIWPLSFAEYLDFSRATNTADASEDELFARYVRYGGMPGLFDKGDFSPEFVMRELTAVHDTVILNDVAKRFELRDIDLLEKLVRYVYTNSGRLFSSRKIAGALTSAGRKTSATTVDAYLNALRKAFLLEACSQVGLGSKAVLQPQQKFYAPDSGLRNRETGFVTRDVGFQLENIVFCELRRRGFDVHVGNGRSGEVDFVATRLDERVYIQVSNSIVDESTLARELSSFEGMSDSFPKIVLTRDALMWGTTEKGVAVKSLVGWLLEP